MGLPKEIFVTGNIVLNFLLPGTFQFTTTLLFELSAWDFQVMSTRWWGRHFNFVLVKISWLKFPKNCLKKCPISPSVTRTYFWRMSSPSKNIVGDDISLYNHETPHEKMVGSSVNNLITVVLEQSGNLGVDVLHVHPT